MAHQPGNPAAARVTTPSGLVVGIPEGSRLVFGRGPDGVVTRAAAGLPGWCAIALLSAPMRMSAVAQV